MFRLLNLALAVCVASSSCSGGFFGTQSLDPARWLLDPFLVPEVRSETSAVALGLARFAASVWAPAVGLTLVFRVIGWHRKAHAPRNGALSLLTFGWIAWLVLGLVPLRGFDSRMVHGVALLAAIFAGPVIAALMAGFIGAIVVEMCAIGRYPSRTQPLCWNPSPAGFALVMTAVGALLAAPLVFASNDPLDRSRDITARYRELCRQAGATLERKPTAPVRSIAYDWPPAMESSPLWSSGNSYQLDRFGRILSTNMGRSTFRSMAPNEPLRFEFTETRTGSGKTGATAAFVRQWPNNTTESIESLTADAVLFYELSDPAELRKAPVDQRAIQYRLTLSDRRSGERLGTFVYVIDRLNGRACGANDGNDIDVSSFVASAVRL